MILNKSAFERLYYEYAPRMVAFAARILGDDKIAEDLVQDTFIRFWEKYQGKESETWHPLIFTMTRNRCLDHLKRLSYKNTVLEINSGLTREEELLFLEDLAGEESSTEDNLILSELNREIDAIVKTLSPRCREVFVMNRIEGLHYKEIADALGISVKAVEKHMSKALKVLRAKFNTKEHEFTSEKVARLITLVFFP